MAARLPSDAPPSSVRWWPLLLIFIAGGGMLYAVQIAGWRISRPGRDAIILAGVINLALYVWVRAWSRLQHSAQINTVVLVVAIQAAFALMLRVDGFTGDGRMILKWRWTPTPEQRLADFSSKTTERDSHANLAKTFKTDSPSFRGSDRSGRYRAQELDLNWSGRSPRELWRHPVGRGWSSFAVVGEFCVTQEQRDNFEAVVCYELRTGREVWQHLDRALFDEITGGVGPRATPTVHEGRVYTFGATGILNCLDGATGHAVWTRRIATGASLPLFGYANSPLIHGRHVFVTPGGKAGSLVAVDRLTGKVVWVRGSRKGGYSSPHLLPSREEDQILVFDATGLHGHAASTGDTRWSFAWGDNSDDQVNVCQPAIIPAGNRRKGIEAYHLLISSGYGRGCGLIEVARSSSGEWTAREVWRAKTLKSKFSCVVVYGSYAYGLDEGILTCISLADGARRWKQGRYGYGQLVLVNDLLLIQAESGRVALVRADPLAFKEVAVLDALSDRTWSHPVVAGRHLLVRSDREAACYELPVE